MPYDGLKWRMFLIVTIIYEIYIQCIVSTLFPNIGSAIFTPQTHTHTHTHTHTFWRESLSPVSQAFRLSSLPPSFCFTFGFMRSEERKKFCGSQKRHKFSF